MPINPETLKQGHQFIIQRGMLGAMSGKTEVAVYAGHFGGRYVFTTFIDKQPIGNMELTAEDLQNNPFDMVAISITNPAHVPNCNTHKNNATIALLSVFEKLEKKQEKKGEELSQEEVFTTLFKNFDKMMGGR